MTDEQFKIWAKSFLERTDTYSSWRGAAVEAIRMIEKERSRGAELVSALERITEWAEVADRKLIVADNWPGALAIKLAREALAKNR